MDIETQTTQIENDKPTSSIKQQVRLMEYLSSNDIKTMYEPVNPSSENRDHLFNELIDKTPMGKINEDSIKPFLLEIDLPMSLVKGREAAHETARSSLFQDFEQDKKTMNIVEFLSRGLFDKEYPVNELELENIIRNFPTPMEAREKIDELFGDYIYKQSNDTVDDYKNTAEVFLKKFYGKRYEYDTCFNELQKEITDERQRRGYVQELTPDINHFSTDNHEQDEYKRNKDGYFNKKVGKMILDKFKISNK